MRNPQVQSAREAAERSREAAEGREGFGSERGAVGKEPATFLICFYRFFHVCSMFYRFVHLCLPFSSTLLFLPFLCFSCFTVVFFFVFVVVCALFYSGVVSFASFYRKSRLFFFFVRFGCFYVLFFIRFFLGSIFPRSLEGKSNLRCGS